VNVKVLEIDLKRQRISLTMRLDDVPETASGSNRASPKIPAGVLRDQNSRRPTMPQRVPDRQPQPGGAMALALARAKQKR